jgi:hypothetical protein
LARKNGVFGAKFRREKIPKVKKTNKDAVKMQWQQSTPP